jgi:GNAT superfamily N-acetyltransferase
MAQNKTQRTTASVAAFLAAIDDPQRRRDAKALAALIRKATGETPAMWGSSIVGYGQTTYQGRTGTVEWFLVGYSPRKAALVVYLMGGLKANATLLPALGPHKVGGGCLYLPRLEEIDTKVLTRLIKLSRNANRRASKRNAGRNSVSPINASMRKRSRRLASRKKAAEDWGRVKGFTKLTLAVFADNRRAKAFYERQGWSPELETWHKQLGVDEGAAS